MHRRLEAVVDATVDVDGLARFCLGRFWQTATAAQQTQYTVVFHDLLVAKIAGHLGEYQGVRLTVGAARTNADTRVVSTTIERPGTSSRQIDWVVAATADGPKIIDLLAEGTSLRETQSSDFRSYLAHHDFSVPDLVNGMRLLVAVNR